MQAGQNPKKVKLFPEFELEEFTQKLYLQCYLSNAPATLKLGHGHPNANGYENVTLQGGDHHVKFDRSHFLSLREIIQNTQEVLKMNTF